MGEIVASLGPLGVLVALLGNGGILGLLAWMFKQQASLNAQTRENYVELFEQGKADNVELRKQVKELKDEVEGLEEKVRVLEGKERRSQARMAQMQSLLDRHSIQLEED